MTGEIFNMCVLDAFLLECVTDRNPWQLEQTNLTKTTDKNNCKQAV